MKTLNSAKLVRRSLIGAVGLSLGAITFLGVLVVSHTNNDG